MYNILPLAMLKTVIVEDIKILSFIIMIYLIGDNKNFCEVSLPLKKTLFNQRAQPLHS